MNRRNFRFNFFAAAVFLQAALSACSAAPENAAPQNAPKTETTATPAKPGPDNTGPKDKTILKEMSGATISADGAVLENVAISGMMTIKANNVSIRNFSIDAKGAPYGIRIENGKSGLRFENGEIVNFNSAAILGMGFHAIALNIHESGADGIKPQGEGGPVVIERCWIHHIGKNPEAHADAIQSVRGDNLTFRHNFFDIPDDVPAPYKANACFILQVKPGPISNVTIESNWLNGGGWTIYAPEKGSNVRIINNKFGRDYGFGIISGRDHTTFEGNVWEDTGEPIVFSERGTAIDPTHVKKPRKPKPDEKARPTETQ